MDFKITDLVITPSAFSKYLGEKSTYNGTVHQLTVEFKKAFDSFWRDVLYNMLAELGISVELIRSFCKMTLRHTLTHIRIGVY
jgi:predicted transcriptional regulator